MVASAGQGLRERTKGGSAHLARAGTRRGCPSTPSSRPSSCCTPPRKRWAARWWPWAPPQPSIAWLGGPGPAHLAAAASPVLVPAQAQLRGCLLASFRPAHPVSIADPCQFRNAKEAWMDLAWPVLRNVKADINAQGTAVCNARVGEAAALSVDVSLEKWREGRWETQ